MDCFIENAKKVTFRTQQYKATQLPAPLSCLTMPPFSLSLSHWLNSMRLLAEELALLTFT